MRAMNLLKSHPEWQQLPCSDPPHKSDKKGIVYDCAVCRGTRDLLQRWNYPLPADIHHRISTRNPVWDRGFISEVECTLAELGEERYEECPTCAEIQRKLRGPGSATTLHCGKCDGGAAMVFTPSRWATEIVRRLPVTRFRLTDYEPFEYEGDWLIPVNPQTPMLPAELIEGHYRTCFAAKDALSTAAGQIVRESVFGKG